MSNTLVTKIASDNNVGNLTLAPAPSLNFALPELYGNVFNGIDIYTDAYDDKDISIIPFDKQTDLETATGVRFDRQYEYLREYSENANPSQPDGIDHATMNKWVVSALEQYTDYEITTKDKEMIENIIEYVDNNDYLDIASDLDNGVDLDEANRLFSIIEGLFKKNLSDTVKPATLNEISAVKKSILSNPNKENTINFVLSSNDFRFFNDQNGGFKFYADNPELNNNFDVNTDLETASGISLDLQYQYIVNYLKLINPNSLSVIDHDTMQQWVGAVIKQYYNVNLDDGGMQFIDDLLKYVDYTRKGALTTTGVLRESPKDNGIDLEEVKKLFSILEKILDKNLFKSVETASEQTILSLAKDPAFKKYT